MDIPTDPYWRLRPAEPTPPHEICHCHGRPPVVLNHVLSENPVHCFDCSLEVPPEWLGFGADLAEQLANWNSLAAALDRLWLDSDEYESWAVERLIDVNGRVNVQARATVARLNDYVRAYHWWFVEVDTQVADCPRCGASLEPKPTAVHPTRKVCEACSISVTDYLPAA